EEASALALAARGLRRRGVAAGLVPQLVDLLRRLGLRQLLADLLAGLAGQGVQVRLLRPRHRLVAGRPLLRVLDAAAVVGVLGGLPGGQGSSSEWALLYVHIYTCAAIAVPEGAASHHPPQHQPHAPVRRRLLLRQREALLRQLLLGHVVGVALR